MSDLQSGFHVVNALGVKGTQEVTHIRTLLPSLHHRYGQDKTVLSCPWRRCELNWRQDKTVFSSPQYI